MELSSYCKIPFMIMRMRRNQRLKPPEIRELQNKKLRALIKHSYDHVPYYHSLFKKAKVFPDDIKTIDDISMIPVSTKTDVRSLSIKDLTANNIDLSQCLVQKTSGTTGIPLTIYFEKEAKLLSNHLPHYLFQLNRGEKIFNKRVMIAFAFMAPPPTFIQKLGLFRTKTISPFNRPKRQLEEIRDFNAKTLIALPSCIRSLAKELKETDFQGIQISLLFTGGEFLDEFNRNLLMESFAANLFDSYGASEVGRISGECLEHNYHIQSDTVFVETTQDGETVSAGEEGEITVTSLVHYVQPFIRYNLEDEGVILDDECVCGSQHPVMQLTSGRVSDVIQLPDGRTVSAHEVNIFLTFFSGIRQFQVIQETIDQLTVKIVKGREFTDTAINAIKQIFKERLGTEIETNVVVVDHIPREKSSKLKLFKTNIPVK